MSITAMLTSVPRTIMSRIIGTVVPASIRSLSEQAINAAGKNIAANWDRCKIDAELQKLENAPQAVKDRARLVLQATPPSQRGDIIGIFKFLADGDTFRITAADSEITLRDQLGRLALNQGDVKAGMRMLLEIPLGEREAFIASAHRLNLSPEIKLACFTRLQQIDACRRGEFVDMATNLMNDAMSPSQKESVIAILPRDPTKWSGFSDAVNRFSGRQDPHRFQIIEAVSKLEEVEDIEYVELLIDKFFKKQITSSQKAEIIDIVRHAKEQGGCLRFQQQIQKMKLPAKDDEKIEILALLAQLGPQLHDLASKISQSMNGEHRVAILKAFQGGSGAQYVNLEQEINRLTCWWMTESEKHSIVEALIKVRSAEDRAGFVTRFPSIQWSNRQLLKIMVKNQLGLLAADKQKAAAAQQAAVAAAALAAQQAAALAAQQLVQQQAVAAQPGGGAAAGAAAAAVHPGLLAIAQINQLVWGALTGVVGRIAAAAQVLRGR